jgi:L-amino acid N-acyltransferase YncA
MTRIAAMEPAHWDAVRRIYLEGIATGVATFETEAPEWERWDRAHVARPRLVALDEAGEVCAWTALTPVSARAVYRGVAELSIFVAERVRGRGVGRELLLALVAASETEGFWTLQAGILTMNTPSRALHSACGFREIGVRERIGKLRGEWRDVVLMERRSTTMGVS